MTGFGKATVKEDNLTINVEIKSLNSRFLDLSIKSPRLLSDKELEFRNLVKHKINRGKVLVNIYLEKSGTDDKIADIDDKNLISVLNTLNYIKDKSEISNEITLDNVLTFQNFIFSESMEDNSKEFELTTSAIEQALVNLLKMRKDEGAALVEDLNNRINEIEESVLLVEKSQRDSISTHHEKLKNRAKELLSELDQYDDRLKLELALLAEKCDVTEECTRLKSHVDQFRNILKDGKEVGRKLNFLIQEMNREANTINSKSVSSDIIYTGLKIKEELERIREQIQNIE